MEVPASSVINPGSQGWQGAGGDPHFKTGKGASITGHLVHTGRCVLHLAPAGQGCPG